MSFRSSALVSSPFFVSFLLFPFHVGGLLPTLCPIVPAAFSLPPAGLSSPLPNFLFPVASLRSFHSLRLDNLFVSFFSLPYSRTSIFRQKRSVCRLTGDAFSPASVSWLVERQRPAPIICLSLYFLRSFCSSFSCYVTSPGFLWCLFSALRLCRACMRSHHLCLERETSDGSAGRHSCKKVEISTGLEPCGFSEGF